MPAGSLPSSPLGSPRRWWGGFSSRRNVNSFGSLDSAAGQGDDGSLVERYATCCVAHASLLLEHRDRTLLTYKASHDEVITHGLSSPTSVMLRMWNCVKQTRAEVHYAETAGWTMIVWHQKRHIHHACLVAHTLLQCQAWSVQYHFQLVVLHGLYQTQVCISGVLY